MNRAIHRFESCAPIRLMVKIFIYQRPHANLLHHKLDRVWHLRLSVILNLLSEKSLGGGRCSRTSAIKKGTSVREFDP